MLIQRNVPLVRTVSHKMEQIPRRYKRICCVIWVVWKFLGMFLFGAVLVGHHSNTKPFDRETPDSAGSSKQYNRNPQDHPRILTPSATTSSSSIKRVLYIVTSLAEYNTGHRSTIKGQDRLAEVVLPVLVESVNSMLAATTQTTTLLLVDVYLILAYPLKPEREQMIRHRLPPTVGLQVWDDACPLGYDKRDGHDDHVADNTRALARQHRYVIKDKLPYYDVFCAFEDDMLVTGAHVRHYLEVTQALERLQRDAREGGTKEQKSGEGTNSFYGPLTVRQLERLIPGFVRVEVLQSKTLNIPLSQQDSIPLKYSVDTVEQHFDAALCCPGATKDSSDVIVWETAIQALAVRQLPTTTGTTVVKGERSNLDWVAFLPGPGKRLTPDLEISSYWSGELVQAWDKKPGGGEPSLIAQQGGWMATREQIIRWNDQKAETSVDSKLSSPICQGSLLPPFDEPTYRRDGQESFNVEYWSGGYQLFTGVKGGCNLQRVVSLTNAKEFSKHFIYHTANNKQMQLSPKRMVRADHLWGQLNTVRQEAVLAMKQQRGTEREMR